MSRYIIGGKWKVLIIYHRQHSPKRFHKLRRDLPDITQHLLTLQLKELVRNGLILGFDYRDVPPTVEYSLTEQGADATAYATCHACVG